MRHVIGVLFILLCGQRAMSAQDPPDGDRGRGVIDGMVTDTSLAPLESATVAILSANIRLETGPGGRFSLRIAPGQYILIIRHPGHRPASAIIEVPANDTARLNYTLGPAATQLGRTVTADQRVTSALAGFEERRRAGEGEFLTQSDIDRRNAPQTADLFRALTAVAVVQTKWGSFISGRRSGCAAAVYVDNVLLPGGTTTDELPWPRDIVALEVYAGDTAPQPFTAGTSSCGVVLIWTRLGS